MHVGGQAGESQGPPRGGRCYQPRRPPQRAVLRGSSWTPRMQGRAGRTGQDAGWGPPGRGGAARLLLLTFPKEEAEWGSDGGRIPTEDRLTCLFRLKSKLE